MAFYGFGKNSGPSFPPKSQTLFGDPQPFPTQPPISQRLGTAIGDPASRPQVSTPQSTSQTPQPVSQRLGTTFGDPPPYPQVSPPTQSTSLTPQSISKRLGLVFGDPPRSQVSPLQTTSSIPQPLSQRLGTPTSHAENGSQVLHRAHLSPQEARINSVDKFHIPQVEGQRSVALSARLGDTKKNPFNHANAEAQQNSTTRIYPSYVRNSGNGTTSPSKHAEHYGPKRTRSPPRPASDNEPSRVYNIDENDDEREARAKAKRLARFCVELSKSAEPSLNHDLKWQKSTENKHKNAAESNFNKFNEPESESNLFDHEKQEQSAVIVGLCEDMCPESERQERERKGDLDQYERFDGERNQTSRSLAVKKYTRTAEREAILIRPMPVLQKTINYLLELLNQPYNSRFLGMYNFLWDRMRAIRMDLRMQHIFDHHAIIMLEQMIRLHIIAMHELCEYKKGEGFSEGFDAHLNIEQMNKTSVELFQLYDDHRKKGINVSTEKEFRGYYALLKLDKHPGYKVEPAELSLDLAKMTSEIRGSQEVLFARAVARACRTGNFIAFFRLARQATYPQACLMHAHFAKLRTQALASLHSGLQNNQGIPITHVVKWLGMEGEDVESLLEYHGFTIKTFEEEYMVKEGLFLNSDVDYPTKGSELVHLKKSENIVDDVLCGPSITASSRETIIQEDVNMKPSYGGARTNILSDIIYKSPSRKEVPASTGLTTPFTHREPRVSASPGVSGNLVIRRFDSTDEDHINGADEEMQEGQDHVTFRATGKSQPFDMPMFNRYNETNPKTEEPHQYFPIPEAGQDASSPSSGSSSLVSDSPFRQRQTVIPRFNIFRPEIDVPTSSAKDKPIQMQSPKKSDSNSEAESSVSQKEVKYEKEEKEREKKKLWLAIRQKQEADKRKMKAILRKWKVQAAKKREMREQRQLLANLALGSVPMGPPLQRSNAIPSHSREKIDIDLIMRERDHKQRRSLSRLNIAGVVGPVLMTRHLKSKCLCWKLVACFHKADVVDNISCSTSSWLRSKLMGTTKENNDELVVPSADVSIWKKSLEDFVGRPKPICFSIVREVQFDGGRQEGFGNTVAGGDALLYLVLEGTPLEKQKGHIHNLLFSIPSGSRLPLLILMSGARTEGASDPALIINQLDLQDTDKMGISTISVIFLAGDVSDAQFGGFLSDDSLRAGLQWLANQSPLRPSLQLVKTRELVLSYLYSSLELCNSTKVLDMHPDQCVAIFNEALDKSAKQVQHAASLNSNGWPCPEIDLLEESSINKRILDASLPKSRWSSTIMVKPIVAAIISCKLPSFSSNLSWLNEGSHIGKYILDQKLSLEELLINYLTQSDTLSGDLAVKEAHLMLQKGSVLEVHDSCYRIVPRWLTIFRRIYNWRLMRLTGEEFATAYVLDNDDAITRGPYHHTNLPIPLKTIIAAQNLENNMVNHEAEMHSLSLDELIEVACRFSPTKPPPNTPREVDMESEFNVGPSDSNAEDAIPHPLENSFLSAEHGEEINPASSRNSSDKLKLLLEQCNMLQNAIEQKLSVYF